jgi:hypothetical protein
VSLPAIVPRGPVALLGLVNHLMRIITTFFLSVRVHIFFQQSYCALGKITSMLTGNGGKGCFLSSSKDGLPCFFGGHMFYHL